MKSEHISYCRIFRISAVFLFALVCSCSVGRDYTPPKLDLPENYSQASGEDFNYQGVSLDWWKAFNDPILNRLVLKALDRNKDIGIALARVAQARAIARDRSLDLLPQSQISSEYVQNKTAAVRFPGFNRNGFQFELYSLGFDTVWELDVFGGLRRGIEAREAETAATIATLHDVMRITVSEVARNYLQLRGSQAQLKVARKNLKIQVRAFEVVSAKFQAGEGSELDLSQVKARVELTRALIPPLEAAVQSSIHRLGVLLGKQPQKLVPLLSRPQKLPFYRGAVSLENPVELLRRRPDLRAAERELIATNADIGVAIAEYYPKISFSGSFSLEARGPEDWFKGNGETYNFGPQIKWSGFNLGRVKAGINLAKAKNKEALKSYQNSVLLALEEIENSLVGFKKERERFQILRIAVAENKKALRIARLRYQTGESDLLTLLDTHRLVLESEDAFVNSRMQVGLKLISIYKALGGGWG